MDSAAVVERFGLGAGVRAWLEEAERLPDPVRSLEVPADPAGVLDLFALSPRDRAEVEGLWPDGGWPPELWHLVECMYRRLCADVDLPLGGWRDWPTLVGAEDARVRAASLWAFAAMVPAHLERQAASGVDPAVTAATLADVGVQVARSRRMFGRLGVETASWVAAQFRDRLFWVGGLQFEPALLVDEGGVEWYSPEEARSLGAGFAPGERCLRLHIPSGGLAPESVDAALAGARGFAREQLGFDPVVATCSSWLLDPVWGEVLGEDSKIVRFQRRFELVGRGVPGESDVFRFVFGMPEVDVAAAPRGTRLERAVVERLEAGGGFRVRTGWLRLA
ncbi:acyltransferase domain-containing protein [Nocardiopsis sp. YSL2]|uniref:acyltransferase domain-containing protein n=1 Tax=Nocardiopsis sp. YSL2 TaxID=2939492 RepID=UPI0026F456DF|nr:acyltransferase domain-containing protein [Nocardiopsis sp. YSL2]